MCTNVGRRTCSHTGGCVGQTKVSSTRKRESSSIFGIYIVVFFTISTFCCQANNGSDIHVDEEPPPGELREGGPRHDNDHHDFRQIRVLPTMEEVLCVEPPYLPRQHRSFINDASVFVSTNGVDRHLDVQFRLLREDMLAPIRRAVQVGLQRTRGLHLIKMFFLGFCARSTAGQCDI